MPELPEVEFCARKLEAWLLGERITSVWAEDALPLRDVSPEELQAALVGRALKSIRRHGKQLFLDFGGEQALWLHLGMTGKWVKLAPDEERRWVRIVLTLDSESRIAYVDARRFGRVQLRPVHGPLEDAKRLGVGPDALELSAMPSNFAGRLSTTRQPIKVALMDQRLLAGVGNIYASEALHRAGLDPFEPARNFSTAALRRLASCVYDVLMDSIRREVGPEIDYMTEGGHNPFEVYGRGGERCARCNGGTIHQAKQSGRSTFWCPGCQKEPTRSRVT